MTSYSLLRSVRLVARVLTVVVVSLAATAGVALVGLGATLADAHGSVHEAPPVQGWPAPRPVPDGRDVVAVVLGQSGSVVTDVLAPYEIFARSSAFHVYTVSVHRSPVALAGGLPVLPDYSFEDVEANPALRPDVVVVPAVTEPVGSRESPMRSWIARQTAQGARILGVCSGARVLAAAGVLDGRRATSFWFRLRSLQSDYPDVDWMGGERYVQDGAVTTTAGVTSGVAGALRLVEQLAGTSEAARIGRDVAYPTWSVAGATAIERHRLSIADLPYALNAVFPWARPTIGVGLTEGIGEMDVAAVFELHSATSSAARAVPLASRRPLTTRHGVVLLPHLVDADTAAVDRLVVPGVRNEADIDAQFAEWAAERGLAVELPQRDQGNGEFSFDPVLRDLAAHADRATARMAAKFTEYPAGHLELRGSAWPWRPTVLLAITLLLSAGLGLLAAIGVPAAVRRIRRRGGGINGSIGSPVG